MLYNKSFEESEDAESNETRYCFWGNKYQTGCEHGVAGCQYEEGVGIQSPICRNLGIS